MYFGQFTEPIGGDITIACESDLVDQIPKTTMERALADQLKSSKFSKSMDNPKRRGCYYTPIPRFIKHKEIRGQELTSLNLDKVCMIYNLLHNILLTNILIICFWFDNYCNHMSRQNCWKACWQGTTEVLRTCFLQSCSLHLSHFWYG